MSNQSKMLVESHNYLKLYLGNVHKKCCNFLPTSYLEPSFAKKHVISSLAETHVGETNCVWCQWNTDLFQRDKKNLSQNTAFKMLKYKSDFNSTDCIVTIAVFTLGPVLFRVLANRTRRVDLASGLHSHYKRLTRRERYASTSPCTHCVCFAIGCDPITCT